MANVGADEAEMRREYEAELRGALGLRDATIKAAYSQWFEALRDIDARYEPHSRHWATKRLTQERVLTEQRA